MSCGTTIRLLLSRALQGPSNQHHGACTGYVKICSVISKTIRSNTQHVHVVRVSMTICVTPTSSAADTPRCKVGESKQMNVSSYCAAPKISGAGIQECVHRASKRAVAGTSVEGPRRQRKADFRAHTHLTDLVSQPMTKPRPKTRACSLSILHTRSQLSHQYLGPGRRDRRSPETAGMTDSRQQE